MLTSVIASFSAFNISLALSHRLLPGKGENLHQNISWSCLSLFEKGLHYHYQGDLAQKRYPPKIHRPMLLFSLTMQKCPFLPGSATSTYRVTLFPAFVTVLYEVSNTDGSFSFSFIKLLLHCLAVRMYLRGSRASKAAEH